MRYSLQMKRLNNSWLRGTLGLCTALCILAAPAFAADAVPAPARDLARLSGDIEHVSTIIGSKVVQIATQSLKVAGNGDEEPTGVLVAQGGHGSGFFVTPDGYLITNAHVVANSTRIRVLIPAPDGAKGAAPRDYPATVVGTDADNDLALLKVDIQGVPCFDLSRDAAAHQGQLVLAYGSPMGLAQSASLGLISATNRQLAPDDPRVYIQTDASMNPGNSGGPLVDLDGRLLGVNTMILSQSGGSEGLGFAVPLEVIRHSYAALRAGGSIARPRLGIQPRNLSADLIGGLGLKIRQGVLVEDVDPNGPGAAAGLLPGDVLVSLAAEPIYTLRDLFRVESGLTPGAAVEVAVMRGPDAHLLRLAPDPAPKTPTALSAANVTEKDNLVFRLGMYGTSLTPPLASTLGGLRGGSGVLVLALAGAGLAEQSALEPADVIHAVNGKPVDSVESLRATLEAVPDGSALVLQVERDGLLSYIVPGAAPGDGQRLKKTASRVPARSLTAPLRPFSY